MVDGGRNVFLLTLQAAPEATREHLVHRAVVVAGERDLAFLRAALADETDGAAGRGSSIGGFRVRAVAADVEGPIALLVGLAVEHGDDGAHRVATSEMRDVAALDAPRDGGKAEALLQLREALAHVVARPALLAERVLGVVVGEGQEIHAMPALREDQRHLVTGPLGEPLRDACGGLGQHRNDYLVGDGHHEIRLVHRVDAAGFLGQQSSVVLREEGGDHLLVGHVGVLHREGRHVGELAAPDVEERQLHEIALAIEAEHVAIDVVDGDDALLLAHLVDGGELIAIDRGELEVEVARRLLHAIPELLRELVVAPVEEHGDRADLLVVPGLVDLEHARRRAALDLVLEARALPAPHLEVGAGPELEVLVDEVERAARGGRRVIRPEVAQASCGIGGGPAHHPEARPVLLHVEAQADVVLVVAELDVVTGPMLLDEVVLEDRRFLFGARDDRVEVADRLLQDRDEVTVVAVALLEVRANA